MKNHPEKNNMTEARAVRSPAPDSRPMKQIMLNIHELEDEICMIQGTVEDLYVRLAPIINRSEENDKNPPDGIKAVAVSAPLAEYLQEMKNKLVYAHANLLDLMEHIEI